MGSSQKDIEVTLEETGEILLLNIASLVSDVRGVLLTKRQVDMDKPGWKNLNEKQQRLEIDHMDDMARRLVSSVVSAVASGQFDVLHARLDNFKVKEGVVTITAKGVADDGALVDLNHADGKDLKITVADVKQFDRVTRRDKVDPDEPELLGDEEVFPDGADKEKQVDLKPAEELPEKYLEEPIEGGGSDDEPEAAEEGPGEGSDGNSEPETAGEPEDQEGAPETDEESGADLEGEAGDDDDNERTAPQEDEPDPDFSAGFHARMSEQGPDENPHDGGSIEYIAWTQGWRKADRGISGDS